MCVITVQDCSIKMRLALTQSCTLGSPCVHSAAVRVTARRLALAAIIDDESCHSFVTGRATDMHDCYFTKVPHQLRAALCQHWKLS